MTRPVGRPIATAHAVSFILGRSAFAHRDCQRDATMTENLKQIIDAFKRRHPETKNWDDDEIVEAMFFILVKQTYSVIPVAGYEVAFFRKIAGPKA